MKGPNSFFFLPISSFSLKITDKETPNIEKKGKGKVTLGIWQQTNLRVSVSTHSTSESRRPAAFYYTLALLPPAFDVLLEILLVCRVGGGDPIEGSCV